MATNFPFSIFYFPLKKRLFFIRLLFLFTSAAFFCSAQSQRFRGYPERNPELDVLPGFVNPPKGYGNVPFYWWNGDSLNRERLAEQLEILASSATDGFAVSYIHTDPWVDTLENKGGHGLYGMTEPGAPKVFSDAWWEIWNWFSGECGRRGFGAGLDDYTVGWVGNGYYPDELDTMAVFSGYRGELDIRVDSVKGGTRYTAPVPPDLVAVVAWPDKVDLTAHIKNGAVQWKAPKGKDFIVYTITTKPGYVIHPEHGNRLIEVYFDRFESRMDAAGREGMNYFFQDELAYPINRMSWSNDFQDEFQKRKGYDITPYLPALKADIGDITPKIRLDYCEVLMDLSEERYYKPIYDWHADRGLLYGCDNLSRGKDPLAYIDYFRAMSWFTAPGNDAPARGSSFLETKVSSSIAHLYQRPRTWLEAFHSMGWGSSGAWLARQIDHHFLAGGNLVCMHGLYYSTHGGWWEWAPPDFHFRMPYWPHMKQWLKYTERMSYLLSQGSHVCDIAVMYPTESLQAYPDARPTIAFETAMNLSNSGLDYDFIDFRSLREAEITDKTMQIADEQYKIIVLADMKAMHHSSLLKIRDFYRAGGIVLATGDLPRASNRKGSTDAEVHAIVKELFGFSANELESQNRHLKQVNPTDDAAGRNRVTRQTNKAGGVGRYIADGRLEKYIPELITPDFVPAEGVGKVLHRKIGLRDVYMVTDVTKDTECFFRARGKVELWDANTGAVQPYPIVRQTAEGTFLQMYKDASNSYLIVFSPGDPVTGNTHTASGQTQKALAEAAMTARIPLDGEWETVLLPTLQNKWGDYRLPAFDGFIGAEARSFKYMPLASDVIADVAWTKPDFDDTAWDEAIYGYGPQAEMKRDGEQSGSLVSFSWQYGVWDHPGGQGYHGLKGKVDDRFFILSQGGSQQFSTFVYADKTADYRIETEGVLPEQIRISQQVITGSTNNPIIRLEQGWHALQIQYPETPKIDYRRQTGAVRDNRQRGFVVLYPAEIPLPEKPGPYSNRISSRWGESGHLMYDPYQGKYKNWCFRFVAAPGLEEMTLTVYGKEPCVWFDGVAVPSAHIQRTGGEGQWNSYRIVLDETKLRPGVVAFAVKPTIGYQGAAIIKEPVVLKTGKGLLKTGDWSATGALRHYSGGLCYRTTCSLPKASKEKKITLDLGDVVATCEVKVNGHAAGILISPPYRLDISTFATEGENIIEVLVYSTLSNHYQAIPTPYRGDPVAGLIGPVSIQYATDDE